MKSGELQPLSLLHPSLPASDVQHMLVPADHVLHTLPWRPCCRYIPNMVAAYDSIGMGACITVVVKERSPSTVVLFQEQLHTNRVDAGASPGAA